MIWSFMTNWNNLSLETSSILKISRYSKLKSQKCNFRIGCSREGCEEKSHSWPGSKIKSYATRTDHSF